MLITKNFLRVMQRPLFCASPPKYVVYQLRNMSTNTFLRFSINFEADHNFFVVAVNFKSGTNQDSHLVID